MALKVRGIRLPEHEEVVLQIDGEQLRTASAGGHDDFVVDGGWLLPGLVDVHTHPGTDKPGDEFDLTLFRQHMVEHRNAGVLAVRSPGSADRVSGRVHDDIDLPRLRTGGQWLATPGKFFAGFGRDVTEADLVDAAVEEAKASSGWCKIIGDWLPGTPPVPLQVLTAAVDAVHSIGGRVAVHCQTAEGCTNAVLAGADSLEHGLHLDHTLLPRMAEQGTALVPTFTAFAKTVEQLGQDVPENIREWLRSGWDGLAGTALAAHEAGVTVLAGTDSKPCGDIVGEIDWLVRAGLPPEVAVGAGSWTARSWLGLPGLTDGGWADIVVYDADPTVDLGVLRRPSRIVLRGRVIL
ncbi:Imidazolonepropionase [Lentzea waywayandensis]|uniref:Imidazolonepropionase n=1 Tax=Lentzea waywayandensis TaxID=84724 RepID=A0A1I6D3C2_9PSEU|nr:amidohydrolase family protein [Lentzea waywayandensis]SFQ99994.1 Imidazolonepropionase [Lentzea waywayandensis]